MRRLLPAIAVIILVGLTTPASAVPVNVVNNGGFETGDFTAWTLSGNTAFTTVEADQPRSGTYAAWLGPISSLGFMAQNITTTPGGSYELSFWLGNLGQPNEFQVFWNGASIFDQVDVPPQPYTQYIFNVVATGASTSLRFGFRNEPSYLLLDDVSAISRVPEPGSLALVSLGLAGAALLLRWRAPK